MSDKPTYDLSAVGPHRRTEVLRRIRILDQYIAGEITSENAIAELGMSNPSFWRLLGVWRKSRRPEMIGASGRQIKPRIKVSDEQKRLIEELLQEHPDERMTNFVRLAIETGLKRGIDMPGETLIARHVGDVRRALGLRPAGVHDLILVACAIDLPVLHPRYHRTASPLMSVLLDVGRTPVVLGLALTHDERTPALAARTILDAIARAEAPRSEPVREMPLPIGDGADWKELANAVSDCGLPVRLEALRPRSATAITPLLGTRPGGMRLFVNRTGKTADKRFQRLRPFAQTIELDAAEEMIKGRLRLAFPGERMAITNDAEARGRLSVALQRIVASEGHA